MTVETLLVMSHTMRVLVALGRTVICSYDDELLIGPGTADKLA